MKWIEFVKKVNKLPVIDTEILLAGISNSMPVEVQISRWRKAKKLIQLKKGLYLLAEPYRKLPVCELSIASLLQKPSYISLEKALEYHGLIPEAVVTYTSVTTKRPRKMITEIGVFDYRHVKNSIFWGYETLVINKQTAFMASPEKALLDYFYLKGNKISEPYLEEMRLQNTEKLSIKKLLECAKRFKSPGILSAANIVVKYIESHEKKEKTLL
jgi:predicted transcriptional regulator of viral defense system